MRMLSHRNVVDLQYFFYSQGTKVGAPLAQTRCFFFSPSSCSFLPLAEG